MPPSQPVRSVDNALRSIDHHQYADLSSAQSYTAPVGAVLLYLDATTQNVRYRLDGVDPTAAIGGRIIANVTTVLPLQNGQVLTAIEEAASATLDITVLGLA